MHSYGLGEMFEGYYADTCGQKISADVDGGLSGVSRCADTGARTPIGVSGIFQYIAFYTVFSTTFNFQQRELLHMISSWITASHYLPAFHSWDVRKHILPIQ